MTPINATAMTMRNPWDNVRYLGGADARLLKAAEASRGRWLPSHLRSNVETPPAGYPLSLAGNRSYDGSEF